MAGGHCGSISGVRAETVAHHCRAKPLILQKFSSLRSDPPFFSKGEVTSEKAAEMAAVGHVRAGGGVTFFLNETLN